MVGRRFFNSLTLGAWAAVIGTVLIFLGAYGIEKGRAFAPIRQVMQMLSVVPMAVPGMVLGLGYIFYFNDLKQSTELPVWHDDIPCY